MQLPPDPPTRTAGRGETVVPMINVVFLLLIFFLMVAELAPPDPVEVTLPEAERAAAAGATGLAIHLSETGQVAFGALRGEAAVAAARDAADPDVPLMVRADGGAPAGALAALLAQLRSAGPLHLAVDPVAP